MTHDNVAGNFVIGDMPSGIEHRAYGDAPMFDLSPETRLTLAGMNKQDLSRFIADEIARQLPAVIRKVLEDDAKEIATNPAFQSVYVPATGVCWACGKGNGVFQWFTRGGHSHLIHKSEECRHIAETKQEAREQQG